MTEKFGSVFGLNSSSGEEGEIQPGYSGGEEELKEMNEMLALSASMAMQLMQAAQVIGMMLFGGHNNSGFPFMKNDGF